VLVMGIRGFRVFLLSPQMFRGGIG